MKPKQTLAILDLIPFDEAIILLKKLIAVRTENPPGNEFRVKELFEQMCTSLGGTLMVREKSKNRSNFIIKIGSGNPSIGFFAHIDTVPIGNGWNTDPFCATVKGGKLYGRGASDNKGSIAVSYAAIKTFLQLNQHFKGTIYLVGCADEERGSVNGVRFLLSDGFKVDYAIVPDGGGASETIIGEKGILQLKINCFGKQVHASTPEKGINAITMLITLIASINKKIFDTYPLSNAFDGISFNIGQIEGGIAPNVVAGIAFAVIDFRFPLGITKNEIIRELKKLEPKQPGCRFTYEELHSSKPHMLRQDSRLLNAFLLSAKELKIPMHTATMGGNTDGKNLYFAGIETIVHDVEGAHTAHEANEYIEIKSIKKNAALYTQTLLHIFS